MKTKTAALIYASIGHLFAWFWMLGAIAAIYFSVTALFFDGAWSSLFWAFGASAIGKWLSKGFMDHKDRVIYEETLIAEGLSSEQAGQKWAAEYTNTANSYHDVIRDYGQFLEQNPVTDEIYDVAKLPHNKSDIIMSICQGIKFSEDSSVIDALSVAALTLAHYQEGVGDEAISKTGMDLSKVDLSKLDGEGIMDIASTISNNKNSDRWEEFWKLVEIDTEKILKKIDNAKTE